MLKKRNNYPDQVHGEVGNYTDPNICGKTFMADAAGHPSFDTSAVRLSSMEFLNAAGAVPSAAGLTMFQQFNGANKEAYAQTIRKAEESFRNTLSSTGQKTRDPSKQELALIVQGMHNNGQMG